jgi:hypothetical protein
MMKLMDKVGHLSEFPKGCLIAQFQGRDYEEAVESAEKSSLAVISYYEQKSYGKSKLKTILVSYKQEENELS